MKHKLSAVLGALFVLLLLTGCGSSGMGDILGGGGGSSDDTNDYSTIRGTVYSVDTGSRTISIETDSRYLAGERTVISYDNQTTVVFEGRSYSPADLERGDRVEIEAQQSGNRLFATRVNVLQDVSAGGTYGSGTSSSRMTVRYVDTRNRTIEVDRYNTSDLLYYDTSTRVEFQGRTFRPEDLERGDVIEVRTRMSSGREYADTIYVVQSVSGTGSSTTYGSRVMRGTVRHVDTGSRVLELDSVSWGSGFVTGNTNSSFMSVAIDSTTTVEYQGQRYGVSNLERGDVVDVYVTELGGGRYRADRVVVVRNSRM